MLVRAERVRMEFQRGTGALQALKETDMVLPDGRLTVLEGRSGSGKTTLLNILAGVQNPSGGKVLYDGTDLYSMDDESLSRFRNDHCGIVPQGQTAVAALTVLENVMLPGTIYGVDKGLRERAEALLEKMKIADLKDVLPAELSGGEIRRMAIARALVRDPVVLFADEPTSDLDDENTEAVFGILREIAEAGKSVLVVTHERNADRYADDMYHMESGVLRKG